LLGEVANKIFVSETHDLYQHNLQMCAVQKKFDLVEEWAAKAISSHRKIFSDCYCSGFELRIRRNEALKVHVDISSETKSEIQTIYLPAEQYRKRIIQHERFTENNVTYFLNGDSIANFIYGLKITCDKKNGVKTFVNINRILNNVETFPANIESLVIQANLINDKYEDRHKGKFVLTLCNLFLVSDQTAIETAEPVIGIVRYFVSGEIRAEVYTEGDKKIL
jgi:hypothetical protein